MPAHHDNPPEAPDSPRQNRLPRAHMPSPPKRRRRRPRGLLTIVAAATLAIAPASAAGPTHGEDLAAPLAAFWAAILARPSDALPSSASPPTPLAELGERLFFDTRLSEAGDMSCATCHQPRRGFADGETRRTGRGGSPLPHHVPSLFNIGWAKAFEWSGDVGTLEDQIDRPVTSPDEMASTWPSVIERLAADPAMTARFAIAFPNAPSPISEATVKSALAAYERTILSPQTRFDRWLAGDAAALTEEERRGLGVFVGTAGCIACHTGWRFTDDARHDIGLTDRTSLDETSANGRLTTGFKKTPGLRGLRLTAPYMHDGRFPTIEAVIEHYLSPQTRTNSGRHPLGARHEGETTPVTPDEMRALARFLRTL